MRQLIFVLCLVAASATASDLPDCADHDVDCWTRYWQSFDNDPEWRSFVEKVFSAASSADVSACESCRGRVYDVAVDMCTNNGVRDASLDCMESWTKLLAWAQCFDECEGVERCD